MTQYDKMIIIRERMLEDYKNSLIPSVFSPYFEWKLGKRTLDSITSKEAEMMLDEADNMLDVYYEKHPHPYSNLSIYVDDNAWQNYEGFGDDKYIVSYLDAIVGELSNLEIAGFF